MSTFSKLLLVAFSALAALEAQNRLNSRSTLHITLPDDSPVAVLTADWGESVATPRGSAMLLDLHTSLTLRNVSNRRIRGVSLLVLAQEVAPGGKASVSVPSLDVGPGDVFPVRLDLRLLRPQTSGDSPLVEVSLDGILFEDLSFYGPNRLNSRRSMMMWELEARRDRRYLKHLLETAGMEAVRKHLTDVQARLSERPRMDVQVARGRTTVQEPERAVRFAFLQLPDEPVKPMQGMALVTSSEARAPQLEITNISSRPVRYLEMGWILMGGSGEEFYAGAVPAEMNLLPGRSTRVQQDSTLKLTPHGPKTSPITGMIGFVSHVEFSDGSVWIPPRNALEDALLKRILPPSPEEQRLSDLYRRKGLPAVVEELRKF
ncbi:MAG: hypothetical protein HY235_16945 [Acidobacteria bacterium]|nr:hypothetical protein [Acidobacteriota bacterium]